MIAMTVRRKYLAVEESVAKEISREARARGVTLFGYTSDLLRRSLEIERKLMSLKEAQEQLEALLFAKELGFILIPEYLAAHLMNKTPLDDLRRFSEEAGIICGRYFTLKKGHKPPSELLKDAVKKLLWNATDLIVEENRSAGSIAVTCILSLRDQSYAEAIASFIEGFMKALSYKASRRDVGKGMVSLLLKKQS